MTRRQGKDGIRLGGLLLDFKAKHKGEMPIEGRSLLDMGFTLHSSPVVEDACIEIVEFDGPNSLTTTIEHLRESVEARLERSPPRTS